jgi:hypothetical protein
MSMRFLPLKSSAIPISGETDKGTEMFTLWGPHRVPRFYISIETSTHTISYGKVELCLWNWTSQKLSKMISLQSQHGILYSKDDKQDSRMEKVIKTI